MQRQFITFIGLPGSGKTTLRKKMVENGEVDEILSPDEIRFYEFETQFNPEIEPQVWSIVKGRLGRILSENKRCLLDATNIDPKQRKDIISIAKDFGAKTKAIVLNIDFNIAYNRNKRHPLKVNGSYVSRTVPDYAMFRMQSQWNASGLGHTEKSIKSVLQNEFDEVEIINRYADEKDCEEMGGEITKGDPSGRKMCRVIYKDDVSLTTKYYFMS